MLVAHSIILILWVVPILGLLNCHLILKREFEIWKPLMKFFETIITLYLLSKCLHQNNQFQTNIFSNHKEPRAEETSLCPISIHFWWIVPTFRKFFSILTTFQACRMSSSWTMMTRWPTTGYCQLSWVPSKLQHLDYFNILHFNINWV